VIGIHHPQHVFLHPSIFADAQYPEDPPAGLSRNAYSVIGTALILLFIWWRYNWKNFADWVESWRRPLINPIEQYRASDLQQEQQRTDEFEERHRGIGGLPIIGPIAKAVYREGFGWVLAVAGIILAGFLLRMSNLDGLGAYIDEYRHLRAAKYLIDGGSLAEAEYRRSLYLVTAPVFYSYKFFGVSLWAARLPGVLFNSLAMIPLYMFAKRINKPVAVLAVALFASSPWMVATSRVIREYGYYPFYFYLGVYLMVLLFEGLPAQIVIIKDWRKIFNRKNTLIITLLTGFMVFALLAGREQCHRGCDTLRIIGLTYLAFGLVCLIKLDLRNRSNIIVLVTSALIIPILALSFTSSFAQNIGVNKNLNLYYVNLLFNNPEQQWYFDRVLFIGVILVGMAFIATRFTIKTSMLLGVVE